jgi:hypothetical protein
MMWPVEEVSAMSSLMADLGLDRWTATDRLRLIEELSDSLKPEELPRRLPPEVVAELGLLLLQLGRKDVIGEGLPSFIEQSTVGAGLGRKEVIGSITARLTGVGSKLVAQINNVSATRAGEAIRRGTVVDTNDADRSFTIRPTNGQNIPAPLSPEHRDAILDAQRDGIRVAVRGVGRFDRSNELITFERVKDVTPLDPLDVPARLDELQLLKAGWLDGVGKSLDAASLERLGRLFTAHYPNELPLPYTFPTEGGGVQWEWRIAGAAPEIEIDLASLRGDWLSDDEEATLDLASPRGWADLADRIAALVEKSREGETA